MTPENTVFFSSCDDYYAVYAIASLLTVRDYVPKAKLALIGSSFSLRTIKLLEQHNIAYYELDLSKEFFTHWPPYPVECYYYFAGPELFHKKGFKYSVYLDGDVLCGGNPLLDSLDKTIGGVLAPSRTGVYGKDWGTIKSRWNIDTDKDEDYRRINAGVIYFDNKEMSKKRFLASISKIFEKCVKLGIPRKGDDSLFSLYQEISVPQKEKIILESNYNFVLQFNEWAFPIKDLRFFHFSLDKPWKYHPYSHEDSGQAIFNPYVKQWRKKLFYVSKRRWLKGYISSELFYRLVGLSKKVKDGLRKEWQAFRGLRYHIWTRRKNIRKEAIGVYWYNGVPNFGDLVSEDIIRELFGYNARWCERKDCALLATGSILDEDVKEGAYVWGSGIIREGAKIKKSLKYCAVRGKLTKERIKASHASLALGDPGLFANIVYSVSGTKNGKIGVMPHYVDEDHPIIKKMRGDERFCVMSVKNTPSENAELISQCRLVVSSSLHGLIFADSFGVPNIHMQLSDKVVGGEYKFRDYYSAVGKKYEKADLDKIFNDDYLEEIIANYKQIQNLRKIQSDLVKAFPFN